MAILGIHIGAFLVLAAGLRWVPAIPRVLADPVHDVVPPPPEPVRLSRPDPVDAMPTELRPVEAPDPQIPDLAPSRSTTTQADAGEAARLDSSLRRPLPDERSPRVRTGGARLQALIDRCYPAAARRHGEEGRGVARIVIDAEGRARGWSVAESTGFESLDPAMGCVARQLRFEPGRHDGLAVDAVIRLPIVFRLN